MRNNFKRSILSLSFIALLVAPSCLSSSAFCVYSSSDSSSSSSSSSATGGFVEMENGDFSLDGIGSVTQELLQMNYELSSRYNRTHYLVEAMAEKDGKLYIYVAAPYSVSGEYYQFDQISIATLEGSTKVDISEEQEFKEAGLKLCSYSSDHSYFKYEVEEICSSNDHHAYTVRQLVRHYINSTGKNIAVVTPVSTSYAFSKGTDQQIKVQQDYLEISSKEIYYQLDSIGYGLSGGTIDGQIKQKNYCLFSLKDNTDISKITKISMSYNSQYFGGYSTIPFANQEVSDLLNYDLFKSCQISGGPFFKSDLISDTYQLVTEGSSSVSSTQYTPIFGDFLSGAFSWLFLPKTTTVYNNITDISKEDSAKWQNWDKISKYQYLVWFKDTSFYVGGRYGSKTLMPGFPAEGIAPYWKYNPTGNYVIGCPKSFITGDFDTPLSGYPSGDKYEAFTPIEGQSPLQITSLSMLQIWYQNSSGEAQSSIVVDSYDDSKGGQQITVPTVTASLWDQILELINKAWSWIKTHLIQFVLIAATCIAGLSLVVWIIKGGLSAIAKFLFGTRK